MSYNLDPLYGIGNSTALYNDHFKFSELPFSIAPDPHFIFMSVRHQEGLAHLLYGINHGGGFVALTGEVGTGKTTLCRCLLQQLPENVDVALILNPKLNAEELLATICDELGVSYDKDSQSLKNRVDQLNRFLLATHANNRKTVLIIDEAQNLNLEVLEQIRLLTNLETSKTKLLQIILVGQPELNDLLSRRELRQLNQRITARYHLLPLSLDETRVYVRHRLKICKGDPGLFNENAIKAVFKYSGGVPRIINIICHCALLGAYSLETREITPGMIRRAAKETLGKPRAQPSQAKPLLALLFLAALSGGLYYQQQAKDGKALFKPKMALSALPPHQVAAAQPTSFKAAPVVTTVNAPKLPEAKPFGDWISNPDFTLAVAMRNTLKLWGKSDITPERLDCPNLSALGLICQFDKGNWKDLLTFNRPAVLEFTLPDKSKRFALLSGVKEGQPIFRSEQAVTFPLSDVLSYWDGYYLLLWQLPKPDLRVIVPGQSSPHVAWLREQLRQIDGINQETRSPSYYDYGLRTRVAQFQRSRNLLADGKVGMQTLFHLDTATGAPGSPHLKD